MQEIIRIRTDKCKRFTFLALLICITAGMAIVISGLDWWIKGLFIFLVVLVGINLWGKYGIHSCKRPRELVFYDDLPKAKRNGAIKRNAGWYIKGIDGKFYTAILLPQTIVLDFYILLAFRLGGSGKKLYLPIIAGDISKEEFRSLVVLLRFSV